MKVYLWSDRRMPMVPRAILQRGGCDAGSCGQFSISISNGDIGLTIRFDSEREFHRFFAAGTTEEPEIPTPCPPQIVERSSVLDDDSAL